MKRAFIRLKSYYNKHSHGYDTHEAVIIFSYYITYIYSSERDKCSALVTRNDKMRLLEHEVIKLKLLV